MRPNVPIWLRNRQGTYGPSACSCSYNETRPLRHVDALRVLAPQRGVSLSTLWNGEMMELDDDGNEIHTDEED
jgi:hypothetical protein